MSEPVRLLVDPVDLRELIVAAQECADDLQTELEARYPFRKEYPTQMRRFMRDMQAVDRCKRAVQVVDVALFDPVYRYE